MLLELEADEVELIHLTRSMKKSARAMQLRTARDYAQAFPAPVKLRLIQGGRNEGFAAAGGIFFAPNNGATRADLFDVVDRLLH